MWPFCIKFASSYRGRRPLPPPTGRSKVFVYPLWDVEGAVPYNSICGFVQNLNSIVKANAHISRSWLRKPKKTHGTHRAPCVF